MYCCPNCFTDEFIGNHIRANSTQRENCSFCGAQDTPVLSPESLSDIFQPIIDLYAICTEIDGVPFSTQVENDWEIFSIQDEGNRKALLIGILGNDSLINKKCKPKISHDTARIEQWNEFREELKHTNRYFPKKVPSYEEFKNLLFLLTLPDALSPKTLYRARINTVDGLLTCDDMGKPTKMKVSNGRANPVGIPYLYTTSDEKTAIAEVRPQRWLGLFGQVEAVYK